MPKREAPLEYLKQFIPEAAVPLVLQYLHQHQVHLTITRERKSVLGDYRHAIHEKNHRISVNGNLNKYGFLVTLIHEMAHLVTFMEFGNRVQAHGREWKMIYRRMLEDFISLNIFPADILSAFKKTIHDLPASSCADENLMRVLRNYDQNPGKGTLVEAINEGEFFDAGEGRIFRKGKRLRKRFQCVEIATGKIYLFSPIFEVVPVKVNN
jgi:hypothetical protein